MSTENQAVPPRNPPKTASESLQALDDAHDLEAAPTGRDLNPRQEAFCQHYVSEPIAMRAAVMAGYAESSAAVQGHRLLRNAMILDRLSELRNRQRIRYVVLRDTLLDKLEAVYFAALENGRLGAAVAAVRTEAELGRLLGPDRDLEP